MATTTQRIPNKNKPANGNVQTQNLRIPRSTRSNNKILQSTKRSTNPIWTKLKMSLDDMQQKSKTIIEAAYKLKSPKDKKELEKIKQYIFSLTTSISKDVEKEKEQIEK